MNKNAPIITTATYLPLDPAKDYWLRRQYTPQEVQHLIETGRVISLTYDFEASDLNTIFAGPTQFCGKVTLVDGQIIDRLKLNIQLPEDIPLSPQAALVTHSSPKALYSQKDNVLPHIAAGQIMLFFRNPYRKLWDMLENDSIKIASNSGKPEEVRPYHFASAVDSKQTTIRLHQGGKYLSFKYPDTERLPDGNLTYRDPDGTRWKKIPAPAMTKGHNIRRYDDRLLWSFLNRYMSDEKFLTHTKKFNRFRMDTLDTAKLVALLDNGGENGFKAGTKIDKNTNQAYKSFTLSSLMEANTRNAVPERGLDAGIRMPDGSKYDRKLAHRDAEYDVDANIALDFYMRKRAPDIVRTIELNADFDRIKPFLIGGEGFEMHPLRAFARDMYPDGAHLHFGVCININEEIKERRQAVMIRTDTDQPLEEYTFRGKKLLDMSVEELGTMLEHQRRKPDALCEIIDLRKNPRVISAEMAFQHGKGKNPDQHEANRRFVLAHEDLCKKLMQAHSKTMPPMPDYTTIRNPQAEEHLFTNLASPKRYEFEMDGKKVMLTEIAHAEWIKALRRNRNLDALMRRAIKPQPVEFENRIDSLEAFIERMRTVDKQLGEYLGTPDMTVLPKPDHNFIPPKWDLASNPEKPDKPMRVSHEVTPEECKELTKNAIEYLWKLRAELMYEFHDNSTCFTVQDRRGHDIPFPYLNRMKESDLADRIRTGEYTIHMEELEWSTSFVARMFRDAGRIEWVKNYFATQGRSDRVSAWEKMKLEYFPAHRALRYNGAPHEDPDQTRFMTWAKCLKEIARIRRNIRAGKGNEHPSDLRAEDEQWGEWDLFVRGGDTNEQILDELETIARQALKENPLTVEKMRYLGYDPENSGLPIEYAPYKVPSDAKIITIDVPYHMIEFPLSHHRVSPQFVMLNPDAAQRQVLTEAGSDTYLFLRDELGRRFLAVKPAILFPEEISPTPYFQHVFHAANKRYEDSGATLPEASHYVALAIQALEPVPCKINCETQTIKLQHWEDFMATVSPVLGYRDAPLSGIAIKDEGFIPKCGAVRLQGMVTDNHKSGKRESGWEVPSTINRLRTLTLKQVRERIKAGREQVNAAAALGVDSIEDLQAALRINSITDNDAQKAGFKSLSLLNKLMQQESFTPLDATHYGYASLIDMKSKLTALFVDQELNINRADNYIHFLDITPANKAQMSYYQPARRSMVDVAEKTVDHTPPSNFILTDSAQRTAMINPTGIIAPAEAKSATSTKQRSA